MTPVVVSRTMMTTRCLRYAMVGSRGRGGALGRRNTANTSKRPRRIWIQGERPSTLVITDSPVGTYGEHVFETEGPAPPTGSVPEPCKPCVAGSDLTLFCHGQHLVRRSHGVIGLDIWNVFQVPVLFPLKKFPNLRTLLDF